jgi:hypothetical protein
MAWKKTYNLPGKIYAGEWNFVPQAISGSGRRGDLATPKAFASRELSNPK